MEALHDKGSLLKYFQNFIKCLSASIKPLKAAGFSKQKKGKRKRKEPTLGSSSSQWQRHGTSGELDTVLTLLLPREEDKESTKTPLCSLSLTCFLFFLSPNPNPSRHGRDLAEVADAQRHCSRTPLADRRAPSSPPRRPINPRARNGDGVARVVAAVRVFFHSGCRAPGKITGDSDLLRLQRAHTRVEDEHAVLVDILSIPSSQ